MLSVHIHTSQHGFAALVTIIIIGVSTLIMALTASLLGLGELEQGYYAAQGGAARSIADGCVDEALRRLQLDNVYVGGTLSLGGGSCIIEVTGAGSTRDIVVNGVLDEYQEIITIGITIETDTSLTINSWVTE